MVELRCVVAGVLIDDCAYFFLDGKRFNHYPLVGYPDFPVRFSYQ